MHDRLQLEALFKSWDDDILHKVLHLKRNAWKRHNNATALGVKPHTWRSAMGVVQHRAALRQHGLTTVKLCKWYATTLQELADVLTLSLVIYELRVEVLSECMLCDIILRRAKATSDDYHLGVAHGTIDSLDNGRLLVANR